MGRLPNTNNQLPETIGNALDEVVEDLYEVLPQQFPPSQPTDDYAPYQKPNSNSTVQFPEHQEKAFNQPNFPEQTFPQPTAASVVPVGHPITNPGIQQNEGWKSELFDCMDDPSNALVTMCLPCVTFGQIAEILDNGNTSCATSGLFYTFVAIIAIPYTMSFTYRSKLRTKFGLIESPAPDWMVHFFCEWCALCQEYRELKLRNIYPTIGWLGNLAIQQQMQHNAMAVPMQQRMM